MPLDTLEIGRGETRRAQEAEKIIKRALVAIDAAFRRAEVRAANQSGRHEPKWDTAPHPNKGWTKEGKEHVHESAPNVRFGKMGSGSCASWCWRHKDELKWSVCAYATRVEALLAAKSGDDSPIQHTSAIESYDDKIRLAVELRFVKGLTYQEIARKLFMKESGVISIFKRLRNRGKLKEYEDACN